MKTVRERVFQVLSRIDPGSVALALALAIAAIVTLGAIEVLTDGLPRVFHLDFERTLPAAFSALLLVAAAGLAILTAGERSGRLRAGLLGVAGVFFLVAVDEALAIHERIGDAVEVIWPVAYLPLALIAALAYLTIIAELRGAVALRLWLLGGAIIACSQLLELVQLATLRHEWDHPVYKALVLLEEPLEMMGSAALLLALLLLAKGRWRPGAAGAAARIGPTTRAGARRRAVGVT
jgi:hypothetical protein